MSETSPGDCPRIGLLNLVPSAALPKTEHQWREGFGDAAQIVPLCFDDDPRASGCGSAQFLDEHTPFSGVIGGIDGLVVTGANLERRRDGSAFPFAEISYIDQLKEVMDAAEHTLPLTVYSCLASHIALQRRHGITRDVDAQKTFGVYDHDITEASWLTDGLQPPIKAPHSRWGNVPSKLLHDAGITVVAESADAGWLLAEERGPAGQIVYIQGHPEYWLYDLAREYQRDVANSQQIPENYFPDNDPSAVPAYTWHDHASRLLYNIAYGANIKAGIAI